MTTDNYKTRQDKTLYQDKFQDKYKLSRQDKTRQDKTRQVQDPRRKTGDFDKTSTRQDKDKTMTRLRQVQVQDKYQDYRSIDYMTRQVVRQDKTYLTVIKTM